jgi:transposase InsO family protein
MTKGLDNSKYGSLQERIVKDQQKEASRKKISCWTNTYQMTKEHGVWWKEDRIVVARDNDLKRGVIHYFHDTPSAGHPGITNTYNLAKRDTWWPYMKQDVEQYVKGCTVCQANKVNTRPLKPGMAPITLEHSLPFQTVAMDFITKLPKSGKKEYDTILTITDHDCTKAAIFIPCHETITAEGVATLYLQHVYPRFGVPKKIISDRDTRFTSKFAKGLNEALGIRSNMSTAYHPQTDGQSERTNQGLETFIRCYCNEEQDNWHIWLPMAEFAHNQWPNATTKKALFDLIMGYVPSMEQIKKPSPVPQVEERLAELEQVRKVAWEAMLKAQAMLQVKNPEGRRFHPYKEGEHMWIKGTNLKTLYPSAKLGPKQYGPFKVLKQFSNAVY